MTTSAPESQGSVEGIVTDNEGNNNQPPVTTGPTGNEPPASSGNPAWQDVLSDLPESLHPLITPKLKEWDANVTRKFQENAEKYKPWEDIVTQSSPDIVLQGLQLMQALETNPQSVYDLIGQHYGLTPAQAQQVVDQATGNNNNNGQQPSAPTGTNVPPGAPSFVPDPDDPAGQYILYLQNELNKQAQAQQQIVEYLAKQDQATKQVTQQQQLESYLKQLHEQNKDVPFDDDYIVTKMANGVKGEDAVKQYRSLIENAVKTLSAPNDNAPVVSGAGGGVPSTQQDITSLSRSETDKLVAEMLRRNAEQRNS